VRVTGTNNQSNFKMELVNLRKGFYDAIFYERGKDTHWPWRSLTILDSYIVGHWVGFL